jgi:hypothetical protein
MSATVTVVLPAPLPVAAITNRGILRELLTSAEFYYERGAARTPITIAWC